MKVLRVFLTVALFSGGIAWQVNGDKGLGVDPNGRGMHGRGGRSGSAASIRTAFGMRLHAR